MNYLSTPPRKRRRSQLPRSHVRNGFTLLELLVTIAIVSVLLGIAAVNMMSAIEASQSNKAISNLRMDVIFSRGEAIKRGGWVGFCGTEDGTACSNDYQSGWLVFHDLDRDSAFNNADTILSWTEQKKASLSIELEEVDESSSGALMFNYRGYPSRSFSLKTTSGESEHSFLVKTTGDIESQ